MSSNWKNWFLGSAESRELRDTLDLYRRAVAARDSSPFPDEDSLNGFLVDLIFDICEKRGVTPSAPLAYALYQTITGLLFYEGLLVDLPDESSLSKLTLEEGVYLRTTLRRHLAFLNDPERLLALWRQKIVSVFSGMLENFPLSAFTDIDEKGVATDDSVVLPEAKAWDLCDNIAEAIERAIITFFDQDVVNARLFESLRERFDDNAYTVSSVPREERHSAGSRFIPPTKNKEKSPEYLVQAYLQGTPLCSFFESALPFAIPFPARFEHTHIVGGTGHGKTQLLQFLINHDLVRSMEDGRSVVVIDSQGDLIRTVSRLGYFSPSASGSLSDRFVLVDPNDVEHPVCLNMFDFNRDRLSGYAPVDREKILNATVELYEYFFGALLGAELTQRQGLIFRYLARLLLEIPNATIHTLREIMEDGERFRPYMEKLHGTTRSFFATQFFDRKFGETKKQILTRLWGVLSNATLERMFSHERNKIDIFELLNQGKVVLINTAKDLLGQEGSAIFGRFFIALIAQAAVQRAAMPPHERRPVFVYIDEAQDYFDENVSHLLNQARKYKVGLVFAHQNLDQLGAGLRSSVLASTTIKFAGGVSAKDANVLDSEFRTPPEFLLSQKKEPTYSEFACYVKNYTARALSVRVPLGYVESLPKLDAQEERSLLEDNRARYTGLPMLPESVPVQREVKPAPSAKPEQRTTPVSEPHSEATGSEPIQRPSVSSVVSTSASAASGKPRKSVPLPPMPPHEPGRGGRQHKYLQQLVKQLAEERGFRAAIEETILDGARRVDVSLVRGEARIAFEISVTTNQDWELGNIEKCLAAGFTEVVLVGNHERRTKTMARFIEGNIEEKDRSKVRYISPDGILEYLDSLGGKVAPDEQTVRGYKVRTVQSPVDPNEARSRREAVAGVIARSLRRSKSTL